MVGKGYKPKKCMINIYTTEIYQEKKKEQRPNILTHLNDPIGTFWPDH